MGLQLHKQVDDICQVDKLTQAAKAAMTEGTAEKVRGFGELGVAGFTHLAASEASFCLLYLSIATKVQLTVHESVAGGDPWAVDADEVRNSGRAFIRQGLPRLTDAIKAAQRAHEKHVHGDADDLSGSSLTVKHSCDDLLVHMAGVDREVTGLEGGFSWCPLSPLRPRRVRSSCVCVSRAHVARDRQAAPTTAACLAAARG